MLSQPAITSDVASEVEKVTAVLLDCITALRRQPKAGTGDTPDDVYLGLDEAILALHRAEGRITGIRLEYNDGR